MPRVSSQHDTSPPAYDPKGRFPTQLPTRTKGETTHRDLTKALDDSDQFVDPSTGHETRVFRTEFSDYDTIKRRKSYGKLTILYDEEEVVRPFLQKIAPSCRSLAPDSVDGDFRDPFASSNPVKFGFHEMKSEDFANNPEKMKSIIGSLMLTKKNWSFVWPTNDVIGIKLAARQPLCETEAGADIESRCEYTDIDDAAFVVTGKNGQLPTSPSNFQEQERQTAMAAHSTSATQGKKNKRGRKTWTGKGRERAPQSQSKTQATHDGEGRWKCVSRLFPPKRNECAEELVVHVLEREEGELRTL
jgi:hypothetical protein